MLNEGEKGKKKEKQQSKKRKKNLSYRKLILRGI
jgi:hypothetical protein